MEIMATPLRAPGSNGSYPRRASASPCHPGQLTGAPSIYVDASGRLSAINVQTPGGLQLDRPRLVTGAPPNIVAVDAVSDGRLVLVVGFRRRPGPADPSNRVGESDAGPAPSADVRP
jgi:hypothetical protein